MAATGESVLLPSSRNMLGHIIAVVAVLLVIVQIILFFTNRWTRMENDLLFGGYRVAFSMNPLLIWIPVWNLLLTGIWWRTCRKEAPRLHWILLIGSFVVGWAMVGWGASIDPPASYDVLPKGERLPRLEYPIPGRLF
ncbi:MAG TPA: hypothetical protein VHS96_13640 [Bacteroidia bacterium]|jgi:hypothetical protein|nr:hypothetical protein [Bacteroidia bacterium]